MNRALNEPLLRSLVARVGDAADVVAVHTVPRWDGPDTVEMNGRAVRVVPCPSPLAARIALAEQRAGDALLVLATDLGDHELGDEVLAQIWRQRISQLSPWDAAMEMFAARLDPALDGHQWLMDLMVTSAPIRGWRVRGGILDVDTAWRMAFRWALNLEVKGLELSGLLSWAHEQHTVQRWSQLGTDAKDGMRAYLERELGSVAAHIVSAVEQGRGTDAIPLGAVVGALWADATDQRPSVVQARTRCEDHLLADAPMDGVQAAEWSEAVLELERSADPAERDQWVARVDQLLEQIRATGMAAQAMLSRIGLRQVRDAIASALDAALAGAGAMPQLEQAMNAFTGHPLAQDRPEWREAIESAVRLTRWLRTDESEAADLATAARAYITDGAWVDAARRVLTTDLGSALGPAVGRLAAQVDHRRAARDRRFAQLLAQWHQVHGDTPSASDLLPIEHVLADVAVPLAAANPILVLVMDGMGHAEATWLTRELKNSQWTEFGRGGELLPPVLATMPSVTVASRAALLTGELAVGSQQHEAQGFADHSGLATTGKSGAPPRLFHKAELNGGAGQMASDVRDAVLDPAQQVVGVVVNAIDDHLAKGAQLRLAEQLDTIPVLRPLLEAASEASRLLVLVSDHGHVIDLGTDYRAPGNEAGERWRLGVDSAREDEVVISGRRVLQGEGRIVAAATDQLRYITEKKHGYHGGATPAEVLCPLHVLSPVADPGIDGWDRIPEVQPAWWEGRPEVEVVEPAVKMSAGENRLVLYPDEPAEGGTADAVAAAWLETLLASDALRQSRKLAGRHTLNDDDVRTLLEAIAAAGWVTNVDAVATYTGRPLRRVRMLLTQLRRLLNVDAYAVMTVASSGEVRVDTAMLSTQFGVEVP